MRLVNTNGRVGAIDAQIAHVSQRMPISVLGAQRAHDAREQKESCRRPSASPRGDRNPSQKRKADSSVKHFLGRCANEFTDARRLELGRNLFDGCEVDRELGAAGHDGICGGSQDSQLFLVKMVNPGLVNNKGRRRVPYGWTGLDGRDDEGLHYLVLSTPENTTVSWVLVRSMMGRV